jgi:cytidylate kinase
MSGTLTSPHGNWRDTRDAGPDSGASSIVARNNSALVPPIAFATPVITIDGGASTGKSTAAKIVSELLGGLNVIDSGLWFRALAIVAKHVQVEPTNPEAVAKFMERITVRPPHGQDPTIGISYLDPTVTVTFTFTPQQLEGEYVALRASVLAQSPAFRVGVIEAQRRLAADGCVTAGRAQGKEVFSDEFERTAQRAVLRVLLWADPQVRAERRFFQDKQRAPSNADELAETLRMIQERDKRDTDRPLAPLITRQAAEQAGYLVIETTSKSERQVAEEIVSAVRKAAQN